MDIITDAYTKEGLTKQCDEFDKVIRQLKDKLHRRNAQIKDLKRRNKYHERVIAGYEKRIKETV